MDDDLVPNPYDQDNAVGLFGNPLGEYPLQDITPTVTATATDATGTETTDVSRLTDQVLQEVLQPYDTDDLIAEMQQLAVKMVNDIVNHNGTVRRLDKPNKFGMTLDVTVPKNSLSYHRRQLGTVGLDDAPRRVVEAVTYSTQAPVAYSVTFMLGAIGAAAGNRIATRVGAHINHPPLWCVVVGATGAGKSPSLKVFKRPAEERQKAATRTYREEMRQWRQSEQKGETPRRRTMYGTGHSTPEAMTAGMETNGGNLFIAADELKQWIGSLDRYHGKGSDFTTAILEMYGYSYIEETRKVSESVSVENPCLALVGGIQPARAFSLFADGDWVQSGFTARFLFCYEPDTPVIAKSYPLDAAAEQTWRQIEGAVSQRGGELPMSSGAYSLYDAYNDTVAAIATMHGEASPERCALSKVAPNLCRLAQCVALANGHADITADDMLYSIDCLEYYRQNVLGMLHDGGVKTYREPTTALDRAETINRWRAETKQPPLNDTDLAAALGVSTAAMSLARKRRRDKATDGVTTDK